MFPPLISPSSTLRSPRSVSSHYLSPLPLAGSPGPLRLSTPDHSSRVPEAIDLSRPAYASAVTSPRKANSLETPHRLSGSFDLLQISPGKSPRPSEAKKISIENKETPRGRRRIIEETQEYRGTTLTLNGVHSLVSVQDTKGLGDWRFLRVLVPLNDGQPEPFRVDFELQDSRQHPLISPTSTLVLAQPHHAAVRCLISSTCQNLQAVNRHCNWSLSTRNQRNFSMHTRIPTQTQPLSSASLIQQQIASFTAGALTSTIESGPARSPVAAAPKEAGIFYYNSNSSLIIPTGAYSMYFYLSVHSHVSFLIRASSLNSRDDFLQHQISSVPLLKRASMDFIAQQAGLNHQKLKQSDQESSIQTLENILQKAQHGYSNKGKSASGQAAPGLAAGVLEYPVSRFNVRQALSARLQTLSSDAVEQEKFLATVEAIREAREIQVKTQKQKYREKMKKKRAEEKERKQQEKAANSLSASPDRVRSPRFTASFSSSQRSNAFLSPAASDSIAADALQFFNSPRVRDLAKLGASDSALAELHAEQQNHHKKLAELARLRERAAYNHGIEQAKQEEIKRRARLKKKKKVQTRVVEIDPNNPITEEELKEQEKKRAQEQKLAEATAARSNNSHSHRAPSLNRAGSKAQKSGGSRFSMWRRVSVHVQSGGVIEKLKQMGEEEEAQADIERREEKRRNSLLDGGHSDDSEEDSQDWKNL